MDRSTPTHELVTLRSGEMSLKHISSGEVMHSNVGPRAEATLLYIEQSNLHQKLLAGSHSKPLVLFDMGLGAATNALASLQCYRRASETGPVRPLKLVSFETDLSGLKLAFENRNVLPFFEGFEDAIESLLSKKHWSQEGIEWTVHEGDFRNTIANCEKPEIVFYDLYSPKTSHDLWIPEVFKLFYHADHTVNLYTYSASTRVRVSLLAAGFFVGYGRSTGAKVETTVAATVLSDLEKPLDERWMVRLHRSHDPLPYGWPVEQRDKLLELVKAHPQFSVSG